MNYVFVALIVDLMNEDVLGPAEFAGHAHIEFPLQRILAAFQNGQVMTPADFSHQWCDFFKAAVRLKKDLHPPEVGGRESEATEKSQPLKDFFVPLLCVPKEL